jgi:iron complex transport system ATP-binding protein
MKSLLNAERVSLPGRLEETSLSLVQGELTCLIGPNGSGKTSLLHAVAGIGGASGQVTIDGIDPGALPPAQRQRLFSYLPASRDVHWPLAAHDLVALGAPDDRARARIPMLLEAFDLTGIAGRRIDRISTGERSRVLIARALVAEPKLLLLDEPAANLDPLWQLRLMDYLRAYVAQAERSVLIAVHDLELARHFADRLIMMEKGAIVADGDAAALLEGPQLRSIFGIAWSDGRWRPAT